MMRRIAEKLTAVLSARGAIRREDTELYEFGFQAGLEFMSCLLVSLLLALLFHRVTDYLLFLLVFIPVRSYAGGFHFESFGWCFVSSCLLIVAVTALSERLFWAPRYSMGAIVGLLLAIGCFPAAENKNRKVEEREERAFGRILWGILAADGVLAAVLCLEGKGRYLTLMLLTLLSAFVSMIISRWGRRGKESE